MDEEAVMIDTKAVLKAELRGLVFNQDPILRKNLMTGTQILHSEQYPTQVFNLKGTKYIRINSTDIASMEDYQVSDLLKVMLSMEDYSNSDPDNELTIEDMVTDAIDMYRAHTGEDLRDSDLITSDAVGNITNVDKLPVQRKEFTIHSDDDKEKAEAESGDDMTGDAMAMADATGMTEGDDGTRPENVPYEPDNREIEQALDNVKLFKDASKFSASKSILSLPTVVKLDKLAKSLLKAFKGKRSKQKRITPRKTINSKSLAMDAEKIYVDKSAPTGKHIEFNLLIDMSGSMGGDPVENAVKLIYVFNKLAQSGYVQGNVLYSTTNYHYVRKFPMSDAEVLSLHQVNSAEGLTETVEANVGILRNMNLICVTDGDICDRPIDKTFWHKNKIISTGVYINPSLQDPLKYSGKLDKWFNHSLVKQNIEDMVQFMIRMGIKG
jgi:hypothetical protein